MELKGKICLITGATSGIGKETAKALASKNAILVLPVRDMMKGETVKNEILEYAPGAQVDIMHCDLASMESVRNFCSEFESRYQQLHILINNAGLWNMGKKFSEDGIELTLAVNHLAPFLLTNLLKETLVKSAPARIINVSSQMHQRAHMYFNDLEFSGKYSGFKAYGQSKLATILFTKKLSQKFKGTGVTANSLHPGVVRTAFFDFLPRIVIWLMSPFLLSPAQGALTMVYLATSDDLEKISGEYFVKCKPKKPSPEALRQDIADQLWKISENYVGI